LGRQHQKKKEVHPFSGLMSPSWFRSRSGGQIESAAGIYFRIFQNLVDTTTKTQKLALPQKKQTFFFPGLMSAWLFCSRRGERIEWAKDFF